MIYEPLQWFAQTIDGNATAASSPFSGTTSALQIPLLARYGVCGIQVQTTSSLAFTVEVSFDNGSNWVSTIVGTRGSTDYASGVTITPSDGDILYVDAKCITTVRITRTAGSGTIAICAIQYPAEIGLSGLAASLTGATINEDSAATNLELLIKEGSVRRDTPATSAGTSGDWATTNQDANGALWVSSATLAAGENLTTNRMMVEHAYSASAVMAADTAVKSGAGFLHTITLSCNDAAPTAGSLIVYDNTAESGTQIFNHTFTTTPFAPLTIILNVAFATGLYFGFTTTADVNAVASYR